MDARRILLVTMTPTAILLLIHGPGNQAAGRFLIFSYFYGFLILRSEQVAGIYSLTSRQVAVSRRGYGFVYMRMQWLCTYVCMCMHRFRLATINK